jgi:uncharacterized membrane protein
MDVRYRRKRARSASWLALLGSMGAGSAAMFLLDPERGPQRRTLLQDHATSALRRGRRFLEAAASDLRNRARGLVATAARTPGEASDELLLARVRSALGHVVSHPHAVEVVVQDGTVTLRGPILASEADEAERVTRKVEGVKHVASALEVHHDPGNLPSLQGQGKRSQGREAWTPGMRLLAGAGGAAFGLWGAVRGGIVGYALASAGSLVLTRSIVNAPLSALIGLGGAGVVRIHKTIEVRMPLESVYGFWSDFENFHRFMQHVRSVRAIDDRHSHWVVAGPAGTDLEWDAVSDSVPYESISWSTTPSSPIHHTGRVRFTSASSGATQVDVQLTWHPAGGLAGRTVASVFGFDPETTLAQDLAQFKSVLESGQQAERGYRIDPG